ncbi:hypothetical protein EIP91_005512 [Steccherinum ochraceum]|uniref:Uncharacterized protein n=1 Tax=Steccherinum ochraceum TaxID=92696 RepID=A0A4R0RUL6_9APHY|nr:hypothetical protein EIP91_005512 [Steccherinum ochraceum]
MRFTTAFVAFAVSACTFALAVPLGVTSRDVQGVHDARELGLLEKRKFQEPPPTSGTINPLTNEVQPPRPPLPQIRPWGDQPLRNPDERLQGNRPPQPQGGQQQPQANRPPQSQGGQGQGGQASGQGAGQA